jgi:outer membrane protein OmpA-like peptidoglycan-associated protein
MKGAGVSLWSRAARPSRLGALPARPGRGRGRAPEDRRRRGADKPKVAVANDAEAPYCTPAFKQVLQRVLNACGLVGTEARRGCQPADVKTLASISDDDFNALFTPLKSRGAVIMFDDGSEKLDDGARKAIEELWVDRRGARYFFIVARASKTGTPDFNRALSHKRANSVLFDLTDKFHDPDSTSRSACSGSATSSRSSARSTASGTSRATPRSARPRPSTGAPSSRGWIASYEPLDSRPRAPFALLVASGCEEGKSDVPPPPPTTGRSNAVAAKTTDTPPPKPRKGTLPPPHDASRERRRRKPPRQLCVGQTQRPAPKGSIKTQAAPGADDPLPHRPSASANGCG